MNDQLLKEAIADAKAVRETAIANAKIALEEAFAPKLQSMLSAKLQNEVDGEVDEFEDEVPVDDVAPVEDEVPAEEFPVEDVPVDGVPPAPAEDEPMEDEEVFAEDEDSFSLDSIIKELEDESIEDEVADPTISDVNQDTENVEEGDVDLEELVNELKNEFENSNGEILEKKEKEKDKCKCGKEKEIEEINNSLNEHIKTVKFLRSKLNEVNLLNAKLLFTNKLFKINNLSESQKLNIVESLDRASSMRECKLVYSTLVETFKGISKKVNKNNTSVRKITEGIASKTIGSTKPSQETIKKVINEGSDLANRFKKLAGIL